MKNNKHRSLCLIFLLLLCVSFNSCKVSENILHSTSDVDFSEPKKVQISFNEHIYDATIVFNDSKLEINFINDKDIISGAYVCLTENNYKITYKDMSFKGEVSALSPSFLPCIIYKFIVSFDDSVLLDSYDKERNCYFVKSNINGYFILLECYEAEKERFYSIEIK